jgi:hypothetical protein
MPSWKVVRHMLTVRYCKPPQNDLQCMDRSSLQSSIRRVASTSIYNHVTVCPCTSSTLQHIDSRKLDTTDKDDFTLYFNLSQWGQSRSKSFFFSPFSSCFYYTRYAWNSTDASCLAGSSYLISWNKQHPSLNVSSSLNVVLRSLLDRNHPDRSHHHVVDHIHREVAHTQTVIRNEAEVGNNQKGLGLVLDYEIHKR